MSAAAAKPGGYRLPPLPPGTRVWWLGTKGEDRAYPVMGRLGPGESLPAAAEWWCVEGGRAWERVTNTEE